MNTPNLGYGWLGVADDRSMLAVMLPWLASLFLLFLLPLALISLTQTEGPELFPPELIAVSSRGTPRITGTEQRTIAIDYL
jgi:hypothetical protein